MSLPSNRTSSAGPVSGNLCSMQTTETKDAIKLKPVVPSSNSKYHSSVLATGKVATRDVIPSQFAAHPTISDGQGPWQEHVHPEGNVYRFDPDRNIVTPDDIRVSHVRTAIDEAFNQISVKLAVVLTWFEFYFHVLSIGPSIREIEYYIVDKIGKRIFWIESVGVKSLGLEPYDSDTYLQSALLAEYWVHWDYFPSHVTLDRDAMKELIHILRHGCIDDLTSPGSTFPWSAAEGQDFVRLLQSGPDDEDDINLTAKYQVAMMGRVWSAIARVRHINRFGMHGARLDRLQGLLEYSTQQTKTNPFMSLGDLVVLFKSKKIHSRLLTLWNGRIVFQRHWQRLFRDMRTKWRQEGSVAAMILLGDIVLMSSGELSPPVLASASFSGLAGALSLSMIQAHPEVGLSTAPEISSYIVQVEDYHHGLRPLSITYAMPGALTVYAAAALGVQLVRMALEKAFDTRDALLLMTSCIGPLIATCVAILCYGAMASV